ncbi:uncharacterized protein LOC127155608 [Labeo rohita]|uniref:uncharacterized protein LOC127155608 n=1 Tax=Labeo rohita TaxID=84645 RepID=UPI0021E328EB|nr:uncharacterized protein LOC127155608 [Labeo rohita]
MYGINHNFIETSTEAVLCGVTQSPSPLSGVEVNSQWLQDFAPYSPSSEVDSSSARQDSPVSTYSWMKQEPENIQIQWDDTNTLAAATETQQDNIPSSAESADSRNGVSERNPANSNGCMSSYQRRKREGKTKHPPVAELSKARQEELRQKWRLYQRSRRNKIRNIPQQSTSQVEVNSQWLQDFAPYSPSSEVDSSSARQGSPVSTYSWMKQEPENIQIQWDDTNTLAAAIETQQDNIPSSAESADSTVIPSPNMEGLPSSVMLTITKLHCLVESKQEKIAALERQVQDLQEDRRFLRTQIENLTSALSLHVCRGISDETTGKS